VNVEIDGLAGLRAKLAALPAEVEAAVRDEVYAGALDVQGAAKRRVPVDTGRLRNSIAVETEQGGLSATVGTNVEYGPFVEYGTRRAHAQPYLFPAFEQMVPRIKSRISKAVTKAAEVVQRRGGAL
jgi:HK97 gp10 family phage protein